MVEKGPVPSPQRDAKSSAAAAPAGGAQKADLLPIKALTSLLKPKTIQTGYGAESQVQGVASMDAANKAAYSMFRGPEPKQKAKRDILRQRLAHWIKHLENATGADAVVGVLNKEVDQLQSVLDTNMRAIYRKLADSQLERNYREIHLLFENAKGANPADTTPKDFCIINQAPEQVASPEFLTEVGKILEDRAKDWTLDKAFSLMAIPGLLDLPGAEKCVDNFARVCSEYQVQLFSDFKDCDDAQQVVDLMENDFRELRGDGDEHKHKRAVSLVCNYLLGRAKNRFEEDEQIDDVWLRPSMALVGVTYSMDGGPGMQQPGAGKQHGKIRGVDTIKFKVNTVTGGKLEGRNVIPVALYGKDPTFMGASTLYTGAVHSVYSIRRTLDYVSKNIKDFLNRTTFQNINGPLINGLKSQVHVFLEGLKKGGIISSYESPQVTATDEMKARYELNVTARITPFFPVKYFDLEVAASDLDKANKKFAEKVSGG